MKYPDKYPDNISNQKICSVQPNNRMNTGWRHHTVNMTPWCQNDWFCSQPRPWVSIQCDKCATLGMKDDNNKDYRQFSSASGLHNHKKNPSPLNWEQNYQVPPGRYHESSRFPTWSTTPGSEVLTWSTIPDMRTSQKYAAPLVARCAFQLTRSFNGPASALDTLRQWISRENFGKQRVCLEHQHRQETQRSTRATAEQTRVDITNKCSIVIHNKIDNNREYCISIHFRMYDNHDNCISIHLWIC